MIIGQFNENAQTLVRHVRDQEQQQDTSDNTGIANGIGNANAVVVLSRKRKKKSVRFDVRAGIFLTRTICRKTYIPAPTMELTRLELVPNMPDLTLGKETLDT